MSGGLGWGGVGSVGWGRVWLRGGALIQPLPALRIGRPQLAPAAPRRRPRSVVRKARRRGRPQREEAIGHRQGAGRDSERPRSSSGGGGAAATVGRVGRGGLEGPLQRGRWRSRWRRRWRRWRRRGRRRRRSGQGRPARQGRAVARGEGGGGIGGGGGVCTLSGGARAMGVGRGYPRAGWGLRGGNVGLEREGAAFPLDLCGSDRSPHAVAR